MFPYMKVIAHSLPFLAEGMGTFLLVFFGCGAICVNDVSGGLPGHLGVSLVFGLTVAAMILLLGDISGAHINPAVTVGFFIIGRVRAGRALLYILSQTAGALGGALVLRPLFPGHPTLGITGPGGRTGTAEIFYCEAIMTFVLMAVVLMVSSGKRPPVKFAAALTVGGVIALAAFFVGPLTGASLNPARSIGPALVSGRVEELPVYSIAPLAGAALAAVLARTLDAAARLTTERGEQYGQ